MNTYYNEIIKVVVVVTFLNSVCISHEVSRESPKLFNFNFNLSIHLCTTDPVETC